MEEKELVKWVLGLFAFFFGQWVLWVSGRTLKARKNINDCFGMIRSEGGKNGNGTNGPNKDRNVIVVEVYDGKIRKSPSCNQCKKPRRVDKKPSRRQTGKRG
jgi:hypothetical protein